MMKLKSISTEGSCQNPIAVGAATAIVAGFFEMGCKTPKYKKQYM
jgi:hypothetical protein